MGGTQERSTSNAVESNAWTELDEPSLADHFIAWKTLEPTLRTLTGAALAAVAAAAIGLAVGRYAGPVIQIGKSTAAVPWTTEVVAGCLFAAALLFLSLGFAQARFYGRILGLSALTATLVVPHLIGPGASLRDPAVRLSLAVAGWCVGSSFWMAARSVSILPVRGLLLFTALVAGSLVLYVVQPQAASLYIAATLQFPLLTLFLIAGTDWAEMTDSSASAVAKKVLRAVADRMPSTLPRLFLPVSASFVAALTLATLYLGSPWETDWITGWMSTRFDFEGSIDPDIAHILISLFRGALFIAAICLALRASTARSVMDHPPSWSSIALVAATMAGILLAVSYQTRAALAALMAASALGMGFAGRIPVLERLAPSLLFAMLASGILVFFAAYEDVMLTTSVGTLVAIGWLRRNRRRFTDIDRPLFLLLVLNVSIAGLQILCLCLYPLFRSWARSGPEAAGALLFVVLLWDLLVSGHGITNQSDTFFPRRARVLLFLAYVISAAAAALLFGSIRDVPSHMETWRELADTDKFVEIGIGIFGQALLYMLFIQRIHRWARSAGFAMTEVHAWPLPAWLNARRRLT